MLKDTEPSTLLDSLLRIKKKHTERTLLHQQKHRRHLELFGRSCQPLTTQSSNGSITTPPPLKTLRRARVGRSEILCQTCSQSPATTGYAGGDSYDTGYPICFPVSLWRIWCRPYNRLLSFPISAMQSWCTLLFSYISF